MRVTNIWEIILILVGISLDTFTVAVCKGSTQNNINKMKVVAVGVIFAIVQSIMLSIGIGIGIIPMINLDRSIVININTWFSAIILLFIGLKIIRKSVIFKPQNEHREEIFSYKEVIILAFAIGLNTISLGFVFALVETKFLSIIIIIFIITLIAVISGFIIGYWLGDGFKSRVSTLGGIILICVAIKTIINYFQLI